MTKRPDDDDGVQYDDDDDDDDGVQYDDNDYSYDTCDDEPPVNRRAK